MSKFDNQNQSQDISQDKKQRERFIRHNWQIKNPSCRIIEDGQAPKAMSTKAAIELAQSMGVDLVEVGYDRVSGQSICKLIEYGKYVYNLKQKEKQAKKQARANMVETKEIQLSLTIDVADRDRLAERAKEFLQDGNKVKIVLRFRGKREMNCIDLAKNVVKEFLSKLDGYAVLDSTPQIAGRDMSCIVRPLKK